MSKVPDDYRFEQRNKYLEDLGLKPWEYGVNWTVDNEQLKIWKKQRKKYGFDDRETYSMYPIFAEWLYSHLMMYKKAATEIGKIDLTYYTFEFEGKTYTQLEAIDHILKWTKYFLKNQDDIDKSDKAMDKLQRATRLWSEILPLAWW